MINKKRSRNWEKNNPEKVKANCQRWRKANSEKICASTHAYYLINKERIALQKQKYMKERYARNRDKILSYVSEWQKNNPEKIKVRRERYFTNNKSAWIAHNLRTRLKQAIKRNTKVGSAVRDLGCSIEEFRNYLENQFTEGMTWDKMGQIHIDHIKPLSSFDLTNRKQFLKACHYTNLQPMWGSDNIKKGVKIM